MSKQNLYVLYDLQAETTIGQIMLANRDAAAVRLFSEVLANRENIVGQYPEHFELRKVGSFDTEDAMIVDATGSVPEIIYTGKKWLLDQKRLVDDSNAATSAIRIEQEAATR